jgi:hypothetical protein
MFAFYNLYRYKINFIILDYEKTLKAVIFIIFLEIACPSEYYILSRILYEKRLILFVENSKSTYKVNYLLAFHYSLIMLNTLK